MSYHFEPEFQIKAEKVALVFPNYCLDSLIRYLLQFIHQHQRADSDELLRGVDETRIFLNQLLKKRAARTKANKDFKIKIHVGMAVTLYEVTSAIMSMMTVGEQDECNELSCVNTALHRLITNAKYPSIKPI